MFRGHVSFQGSRYHQDHECFGNGISGFQKNGVSFGYQFVKFQAREFQRKNLHGCHWNPWRGPHPKMYRLPFCFHQKPEGKVMEFPKERLMSSCTSSFQGRAAKNQQSISLLDSWLWKVIALMFHISTVCIFWWGVFQGACPMITPGSARLERWKHGSVSKNLSYSTVICPEWIWILTYTKSFKSRCAKVTSKQKFWVSLSPSVDGTKNMIFKHPQHPKISIIESCPSKRFEGSNEMLIYFWLHPKNLRI